VDFGPNTLWHVDVQWCILLYCIYSSSSGNSIGQVIIYNRDNRMETSFCSSVTITKTRLVTVRDRETKCSSSSSTAGHQINNVSGPDKPNGTDSNYTDAQCKFGTILKRSSSNSNDSTVINDKNGATTDNNNDLRRNTEHIQRKPHKKKKKHVSLEAKRERKAAKTLAIVTGAFIICWFPFFVLAVMNPICENCINGRIFSFFLWLGYFNSTLNPIIYTVFSPEFRQAFKKLLCGRPNHINYRPRHLQWLFLDEKFFLKLNSHNIAIGTCPSTLWIFTIY